VRLPKFFDQRNWHAPPAMYAYDFGDDWQHVLVHEGLESADDDRTYPRCVDGRTLGQRLAPIGRIGADGAFMTVGLPPGSYILAVIPDPVTPGDALLIPSPCEARTPGNVVHLGTEDLTSVEVLLGRATAHVMGARDVPSGGSQMSAPSADDNRC
jgi:hypothetical protein